MVTATFTDAQSASEHVYVFHNAVPLFQEQTGTPTGSAVTYSGQVEVAAAGETLDFFSSGVRCTAAHIVIRDLTNSLAWDLGADFTLTNGNPNRLSGPRAGSAWVYGEYQSVPEQKLDYDLMRRLTQEFTRISPNLLGDYYPLTPYSTAPDAWMAWQFDVPEKGTGLVQVFRRSQSPFLALQVKLKGLDPEATYAVTDLDIHRQPTEYSGRQLLQQGLAVEIPDQPGAAVVTYKRLDKRAGR
jgi:hypothetical protein